MSCRGVHQIGNGDGVFRLLIKFVKVRFEVYSFSLYGTYRYKGILEVRLVFREYSIGVKMKNSGTIEVLQRYFAALCFLDVLEMVVR